MMHDGLTITVRTDAVARNLSEWAYDEEYEYVRRLFHADDRVCHLWPDPEPRTEEDRKP